MALKETFSPLLNVFPQRGIELVRGRGAKVWDCDGKEYIDCVGGWGVANVGHANEDVIDALFNQSSTLLTCPGIFANPQRTKLASLLVDISPHGLNRVFFVNSGTEALEAAVKFALLSTGKNKFVATMRGFHGRTLGSLALTHSKKYRGEFEPLLHHNVEFVPFNNIERLREAISDDVAAVIVEPVQGEGGVHIPSSTYLKEVKEICELYGALLIVDEVQTGFGRTGRMFAVEHFDVVPDILCVAKALGGGVPIGAVLVSDRVQNISPGKHGTTFGGNPLAAAAGVATINYILENELCSYATKIGGVLMDGLRNVLKDVHEVREIRGIGLMVGVELRIPAKRYVDELTNAGVLVIPTGAKTIRLLPPLVISLDEVNAVVSAFDIVFHRLSTHPD